jgi:hypothetical protein
VVIRYTDSPRPAVWQVNPGAHALISDGQPMAGAPDDPEDDGGDVAWSMVGTVPASLEVLAGRMKLNAAFRRKELTLLAQGQRTAPQSRLRSRPPRAHNRVKGD